LKTLFSCTIEDFGVIPKRRSPNKARYKVGSPTWKYYQNRDELAQLFAFKHKGEQITVPVTLSCVIHLAHRRVCDLDNLVGCLQDSLVVAGILRDDSLIREFDKCNMYQKAKGVERVVVSLKEYLEAKR